MDNKSFNKQREARILKHLSGSITDIKKEVETVMAEKANAEVLQHMQSQNQTQTQPVQQPVAQPNISGETLGGDSAQGMSQAKVRTLVKNPNAPKVVQSTPNTTETPGPRAVNYSSEPVNGVPENYFDTIRNGGSANASSIFIVIAAFVIVIMVIMICLTIINSFGIGL